MIMARQRIKGKHLPQLPSDVNPDQSSDSVGKDLGQQDINANNRKRPPLAATGDGPARESKSSLFRGLFGSKKK